LYQAQDESLEDVHSDSFLARLICVFTIRQLMKLRRFR
ncbi:hypothetical protein HKBW3C_02858, partial [Candidatus Hakubella thermalkaliphila]